MPKPISEELFRAYEATVFVVLTEPELALRIGVHSADADLLLASHGATNACIVTAWNPLSQTLSANENNKRQAALVLGIDQHGLRRLNAEGRDPDGQWPSEESLCVFDAPVTLIDEWMRTFGQNAVVVVGSSEAPALVLHPELEQP